MSGVLLLYCVRIIFTLFVWGKYLKCEEKGIKEEVNEEKEKEKERKEQQEEEKEKEKGAMREE